MKPTFVIMLHDAICCDGLHCPVLISGSHDPSFDVIQKKHVLPLSYSDLDDPAQHTQHASQGVDVVLEMCHQYSLHMQEH